MKINKNIYTCIQKYRYKKWRTSRSSELSPYNIIGVNSLRLGVLQIWGENDSIQFRN